jgi:MFS family permease
MKFGYRLKNFSLVMSLPSIVFLILPIAGFLLSPRATHTATTARAGWLTIIFFGVFFSALITLALYEYRRSHTGSRVRGLFIAAVVLQMAGSVFLISTPGFGTLYWDSYHVIRMTSETLLIDWRSLFFDALAFYLLQLWDHVYTVPLFGAALLAVTLSIPILWCRKWQRAMVVALLVTVLALTPFFLTYASALFSDTFFTSFSLLSIYALMTVAERFDPRNEPPESWARQFSASILFVLTAIAAVQLRHNGVILAGFLMVAAISLVRHRIVGVGLACCLLMLMVGMTHVKNSRYFPDANRDALLTNRNFQTVALVLNPWGAMLTASGGYKTPSREVDLQKLSYFIEPRVLVENFDSKNPIPAWEKFASPWRQISNDKTKDFFKLSVLRILQNLPLVAADKVRFLASMATEWDVVPMRIEKECALASRQPCPSFGDDIRSRRYYSQIQTWTLPWPQQLDGIARQYIQHQEAPVWLGLSLIWFVLLLCAPGKNWWAVWMGLYGLAMTCALALVIPAPEFRYFFPVVSLFPASLALAIAGVLRRQK